jgi:hypothetical protein
LSSGLAITPLFWLLTAEVYDGCRQLPHTKEAREGRSKSAAGGVSIPVPEKSPHPARRRAPTSPRGGGMNGTDPLSRPACRGDVLDRANESSPSRLARPRPNLCLNLSVDALETDTNEPPDPPSLGAGLTTIPEISR